MTENRLSRHVTASVSLPTFAAVAIVLWVVLEFALRRGVVALLADPLGTARGADAIVLLIGFPIISGLIAWLGIRVGIRPADWGYTRSLRDVAAGIGGFGGYMVVFVGITVAVTAVGGLTMPQGSDPLGLSGAPAWAFLVLFVGNGIIVPITEELAWRGVIQTALMESYGTHVGIILTAAAFVLKHLIVDLSAQPLRVASLVVLALVLGGLRARYGTTSSTAAHLAANALSTGLIVFG